MCYENKLLQPGLRALSQFVWKNRLHFFTDDFKEVLLPEFEDFYENYKILGDLMRREFEDGFSGKVSWDYSLFSLPFLDLIYKMKQQNKSYCFYEAPLESKVWEEFPDDVREIHHEICTLFVTTYKVFKIFEFETDKHYLLFRMESEIPLQKISEDHINNLHCYFEKFTKRMEENISPPF